MIHKMDNKKNDDATQANTVDLHSPKWQYNRLKYGKVIHICSILITTAMILAILIVSVCQIPKLTGIQAYITLSKSMEPIIPVGALVFVDTKDTNIAEGDIITYKLPVSSDATNKGVIEPILLKADDKEMWITHRIVRKENEKWITKEDANDMEDSTSVSQEQIVGSYCFYIPLAGWLTARFVCFMGLWLFLLNRTLSVCGYVFECNAANLVHRRST